MNEWLSALRRAGEADLFAVLVTVAHGKGSTPREAGTKMVVLPNKVHGTVGGGELEFQAIAEARNMLASADSTRSVKTVLGAELGQNCGGAANLLLERVGPGTPWVAELTRWIDRGESGVRVSVLEQADAASVKGPLLVGHAVVAGTLDVPSLDTRAIELARRLVVDPGATSTTMTEGEVTLLLDPIRPTDFRVVLFGAGHVGRALVRVLGALPCEVEWIDGRAGEFPSEVPHNVRAVITDQVSSRVAAAHPGSYFIVMTHSHALDLSIIEAVLARKDFAYCGLIGSATKRRSFDAAMIKHGLTAAHLSRLTCPIGIPELQGKEPGTIAVGVAAQLLGVRERRARIPSTTLRSAA